ncbi:hypothetical protein C6N29_04720 [Flavobacterium columnare]|nr:hypothetical protein C6N29_04720 [Flavobacterium columnare]
MSYAKFTTFFKTKFIYNPFYDKFITFLTNTFRFSFLKIYLKPILTQICVIPFVYKEEKGKEGKIYGFFIAAIVLH